MGIGRAGPDRPSRGVWVAGDERVAIFSVLKIAWNYDKKDRQRDFNNHDGCRNTHGQDDIRLSTVRGLRLLAAGGVTGVRGLKRPNLWGAMRKRRSVSPFPDPLHRLG